MTDAVKNEMEGKVGQEALETDGILIDCLTDGSRTSAGRYAIPAVVIAVVLLICLFYFVIPTNFAPVLIALVVLCLLGYVSYRQGTDKNLKELLSPALGAPTIEAIREAATPRWYRFGDQSQLVCEQLLALRQTNLIIRVAKTKELGAARRINDAFEPVPLDESANLFHELDQATQRADQHLPATSGFARNIKLGGGWLAMVAALLWLLMGAFFTLKKKEFNVMLFQASFMLFVLILGIGRGAWKSNKQWFLVPGGVVVRRSRRWRMGWDLGLFRRTEGVMYLRSLQHIWTACVAEPGTFAKVSMTPREADMLLSAWLSPVPTPPLEQLSDLH